MGRHREFETDVALAQIKQVFWEYGYEGASMALIEDATGLKKQSLYRAFGDKRCMYLAALRDYDRIEVAAAVRLLNAPGTARQRIDGLLTAVINEAVASGDRRGCLLCNASVDQAPHHADTAVLIDSMMTSFCRAIEHCLAEHAPTSSARKRHACASAVLAAYFGLRVMIKAGLPKSQLDLARQHLVSHLLA